MTTREMNEGQANRQSESLIENFAQFAKDTGILVSIMINYYRDGTIEYNIEHDTDHYGDGLPLTQVMGLLYHASETIIQNSKEPEGESKIIEG